MAVVALQVCFLGNRLLQILYWILNANTIIGVTYKSMSFVFKPMLQGFLMVAVSGVFLICLLTEGQEFIFVQFMLSNCSSGINIFSFYHKFH